MNVGNWTGTWDNPPGRIQITFTRQGGGAWNKKLTGGTFDDGSSYMASLEPNSFSGTGIDILADNSVNPSSVLVTDAYATVVTDPSFSFYNSPTWFDATGTTESLPSGTLSAGASDVPWGGPVDIGANQWLLISASFDGVTDYMGYADAPEPATLALLGIGAIGLLARRRRAAPYCQPPPRAR